MTPITLQSAATIEAMSAATNGMLVLHAWQPMQHPHLALPGIVRGLSG